MVDLARPGRGGLAPTKTKAKLAVDEELTAGFVSDPKKDQPREDRPRHRHPVAGDGHRPLP